MGFSQEKVSAEQLKKSYERNGGNIAAVARDVGLHVRGLRKRMRAMGLCGGGRPDIQPKTAQFELGEVPPKTFTTADLLAVRKAAFLQRTKHEKAVALRPVKVRIQGPIAIHHFGDPHIDDDGTDIVALERHKNLISKTPGMFAGNVGDTTNNWVGRLARLYANQTTTAAQAWQLAEWFLTDMDWLYVIAGNHDLWSGDGDPIKWIISNPNAYSASAIRFELQFPNGRRVRVNARHDFPGGSQWNPAHGSMKSAQIGHRDHLHISGHRHMCGYGVVKDPNSQIISHCIQVGSYKVYDEFAKEKGFRDQHISPCAVTVVDPEAASESGLIHMFWEPEEAAEYLTYMRAKRKC